MRNKLLCYATKPSSQKYKCIEIDYVSVFCAQLLFLSANFTLISSCDQFCRQGWRDAAAGVEVFLGRTKLELEQHDEISRDCSHHLNSHSAN